MKHTVELSRKELEEAIREYLSKSGYCLSDPIYGTPIEMEIGDIDVGNQHKPKIIRTVIKVICTLSH